MEELKPDRHIVRRMGYHRDQDGIMNRYLREGPGWHDHLENTRGFINESFRDPAVESVAILGSGWLLDVPLEDMVQRFSHIVLADIRHPAQVRRKVKGMENVELVETDLTGGAIEYIWHIAGRRQRLSLDRILKDLDLRIPSGVDNVDALVSVNLLNQLDIHLCDHMRSRGYFQHEPSDAIRTAIQHYHMEWITSRPGCLVTDTREISRDQQDKEKIKNLIYTDLPSGFRNRQWNWAFDTHSTYHTESYTIMEVRAIEWT